MHYGFQQLIVKNNNFDANIGRFGMNLKNAKPDEGPHSVVVEYCFLHISVFPSIFLKQNCCWKLMSLSYSIHFSSRCDPWINLRMSINSSNIWKKGYGMYSFLIQSINYGRRPKLNLFNVTKKWLNIWSIWSWVCPTIRKPTFTFWKISFQKACLDI